MMKTRKNINSNCIVFISSFFIFFWSYFIILIRFRVFNKVFNKMVRLNIIT